MTTSDRTASRTLMTFAVAGLLVAPLLRPAPARAGLDAKAIAKCQKSLDKAAQKLFTTKMGAALGCAQRLLACQLAEELDGEPFAACSAKALSSCNKKLAKVAGRRSRVGETITAKCPDLADWNFSSRRGLGYADVADACASLVPAAASDDPAAIADCVVRFLDCRADDALERLLPRSYEVFDRAGVLTSFAGEFPCLDLRAASPASSGSAKDLSNCQAALQGGAWKKLKIQQKSLHSCADRFLSCQLPIDRVEIGPAAGGACTSKALGKCDKKLAKVSKLATVAAERVTKKCTGVALADALSGLGFAADCGSATTIDELRTCADAAADTSVEEAVGIAEPRSCPLLAANGRAGGFESVCLPFCGNGVVEGAEVCDDANRDDVDGCRNDCTPGSTTFVTLTLASTAQPADTPDGTAGTAVAPGSSLAIQFGSTTFDLNRAIYTRFYVPGAGHPNAVLILIPGFAGGPDSCQYLA